MEGTVRTMVVVDPLNRKLDVPIDAIQPTLASKPGAGPRGVGASNISSLCLLALEGRCRRGTECNQVHADPAVIRQLREEAAGQRLCCKLHGDVHARSLAQFPQWADKPIKVGKIHLPLERLAFTQGLRRSMMQGEFTVYPQPTEPPTGAGVGQAYGSASESPVASPSPSHPNLTSGSASEQGGGLDTPCFNISPSFICKLHAGGNCRYAEDCKFVHVCREFTETHLQDCVQGIVRGRVPVASKKMKFGNKSPHNSPPYGSAPGVPHQQQQYQSQHHQQQQQQQPQRAVAAGPNGEIVLLVNQSPPQHPMTPQQQQQVQLVGQQQPTPQYQPLPPPLPPMPAQFPQGVQLQPMPHQQQHHQQFVSSGQSVQIIRQQPQAPPGMMIYSQNPPPPLQQHPRSAPVLPFAAPNQPPQIPLPPQPGAQQPQFVVVQQPQQQFPHQQ